MSAPGAGVPADDPAVRWLAEALLLLGFQAEALRPGVADVARRLLGGLEAEGFWSPAFAPTPCGGLAVRWRSLHRSLDVYVRGPGRVEFAAGPAGLPPTRRGRAGLDELRGLVDWFRRGAPL